MYNGASKVCMACLAFVMFFRVTVFSQSEISFGLKGNNNEVYNNQSTTYHMDVEMLFCADSRMSNGAEIRSIAAFVDLTDWCTRYLDAKLHMADSTKNGLYTRIYEIKNSNDEVTTLRLINESIQTITRFYLTNRNRLGVAEIDVFHQKYDELKSFKILNCLGDRFKLKKSDISGLNYLESDSVPSDVRDIDFELFEVCDGMRRIRVNGRYGYTENDSTFTIEATFSTAHNFSCGLALVKNHTEQWFINKKGVPVLSLASRRYLNVCPFKEGYARIKKENGLYNFIDVSGRELFGFDFRDADDFSGGMAAVCINPLEFYEKIKTLPKYKKHAGYLRRNWHSDFIGPLDEVYGYIDANGFFRITPRYALAFSFTAGGHAPVSDFSVCEYIGGSLGVPYTKIHYHTYLIDSAGNKCSGMYCYIKPIGNDLLLAKCADGYFGVFGPSGMLLGDCFYGEPVLLDQFLVYADGTSHKYGVMNKNGTAIIPSEYDEIRFLGNSQFELEKGGYKTTVYVSPDLKINKIKQQKMDSEKE